MKQSNNDAKGNERKYKGWRRKGRNETVKRLLLMKGGSGSAQALQWCFGVASRGLKSGKGTKIVEYFREREVRTLLDREAAS